MTVTNTLRDLVRQHVNSDMLFTDDGRCERGWEGSKKEEQAGVWFFNMFADVILLPIERNFIKRSPDKSNTCGKT